MTRIDPIKIDAVISCGRLGIRLGKITKILPKSMIRVGNYPFLNIPINYIANFGVKRFILCIGYKGEIIKNHY